MDGDISTEGKISAAREAGLELRRVPTPPATGLYALQSSQGKAFWKKLKEEPPKPVAAKTKKLFVLIGQSNAQSANQGPITAADAAHPRVFQYSRGLEGGGYDAGEAGEWIPAQDPLQHLLQHHSQSVGFGLTFAKKILEQSSPEDEVYLLCCALGGTGFMPSSVMPNLKFTWDPDQPHSPPYFRNLLREAITDTNTVLKANPDLQLEGIIWHQGENDAYLPTEQYLSFMKNLVNTFRTEAKTMDKNILFICGGMLESWRKAHPMTAGVDAAHRQSPNHIWLGGFADSDGIDNPATDKMDLNDTVHFSASSQRELGERIAQVYTDLKAKKEAALARWLESRTSTNKVLRL